MLSRRFSRGLPILCALSLACACAEKVQTVELSASPGLPVELEAPAVPIEETSYVWEVVTKPAGAQPQLDALVPPGRRLRLIPDREGIFEVLATARDGEVLIAGRRFRIAVENAYPTSAISVGLATTSVPALVSGESSADPNGDALSYSWTVEAIPPGANASFSDSTAPSTTFVTDRAGQYEIALKVEDPSGAVDEASHTFPVYGPAFEPLALDQSSAKPGYSRPREQLFLAGSPLKVLDIEAGTVTEMENAGDGSVVAVDPSGSILALYAFNSPNITIFDLDAEAPLVSRDLPGVSPCCDLSMSEDALYIRETRRVDMWHWPTDELFQSPEFEDAAVRLVALSSPLDRLFVTATDNIDGVYRVFSLDAPPTLLHEGETGGWNGPLGPVGFFEDGRRFIYKDGRIARLGTQAIESVIYLREDFQDFAHNASVNTFALVYDDRLRLFRDTDYNLREEIILTRWMVDTRTWLWLFPYRDGILVLEPTETGLRSLYIPVQ